MKLKLKDLNQNPFKKEINKGRLDEDTIKKIQANMIELGLMGSIPVVKRDNKFYLVSHHHRVEALKREFGKDFEVDVDLKNYSDDQLLRGMVVENLTQRNNEYAEEEDNILAIKKHLVKDKMLLDDKGIICPTGGQLKSKRNDMRGGRIDEYGSVRQICLWLDKNTGDVLKKSTISDRIAVYEKLNPELKKKIEKIGGGKAPDDVVTVKQATELVRVTQDKEEQKDLWDAMKKEEGRPHELLTLYKNSDEETKKEVRDGKIRLRDLTWKSKLTPIDLPKGKILTERNIELRESFDNLTDEINKWKALALQNCNEKQLEKMYLFLLNWSKLTFAPFVNELINNMKGGEKHGIYTITG